MRVIDEVKIEKLAAYVKQYAHDNNETPSLMDIMAYMNMSSKSVAYRYLMALKERGIIEYNGKGTMTMDSVYTKKTQYRRVPILGQIICGSPEEEEENAEDYLALPVEWLDGDCFLLRAKGDSMIDVGVEAGDLVLVKKVTDAADGKIVVALTEEGNTLKRLRYENGKPVLYAENSTYLENRRIIRPKQLSIQGIVLKLIKDFK